MSNKRSTLWFKQETQVKELDSVSNSPPGRFSRTLDHQPLWYFVTRSVGKVTNALTSPVASVSNLPSVWTRRPPPRWLYYYIYTWSPANYSFKDTCVSHMCPSKAWFILRAVHKHNTSCRHFTKILVIIKSESPCFPPPDPHPPIHKGEH